MNLNIILAAKIGRNSLVFEKVIINESLTVFEILKFESIEEYEVKVQSTLIIYLPLPCRPTPV